MTPGRCPPSSPRIPPRREYDEDKRLYVGSVADLDGVRRELGGDARGTDSRLFQFRVAATRDLCRNLWRKLNIHLISG